VGEARAAAPLVHALSARFPDCPVVVSTSTLTGQAEARRLFKNLAARVFYFPYDLWPAVSRALSRVRPKAVVLCESDIWPNFLYACHRQNIPLVLANARLSPQSARGYRLLGFFIVPLYRLFSRVCVQSAEERERFIALGLDPERVIFCGNLKYDQAAAPEGALLSLKDLGLKESACVLVAGSTHPGEEEILCRVMQRLKDKGLPWALVVAPRNPARAREAARCFPGFKVRLLSGSPVVPADVCVVDRMGLLSGLYSLGHAAFVGGSLVNEGGHNPIEPAAHGKPVVFGPFMSDFPAPARMLLERGAARQVSGEEELCGALRELHHNPETARNMGTAGKKAVLENLGAAERCAAETGKAMGL
jgi:3-deoxy-D-manno-octulosonic-acid transferase